MRGLIQRLCNLGVFIEYRIGAYSGQRVRVWGEDGRPVSMLPGTARVYADRLEAKAWGFPV